MCTGSGEIAMNWNKVADVSDPSLFIYYDFEEGPNATVYRNKGIAGKSADLYNGEVIVFSYYYYY